MLPGVSEGFLCSMVPDFGQFHSVLDLNIGSEVDFGLVCSSFSALPDGIIAWGHWRNFIVCVCCISISVLL